MLSVLQDLILKQTCHRFKAGFYKSLQNKQSHKNQLGAPDSSGSIQTPAHRDQTEYM